MDSNVSDEERRVALKFCNKHLDGAWRHVTLDQLIINAVSGGMTNLLYRCTLNENVELNQSEPRQVLLRIYGPSKCNVSVQISIFNQLANSGLGPKLYSTFDEGRFEEYLPSSPLTWSQLTDVSISQVVAEKIAAIHRLSVQELDKKAQWLVEYYHEMNQFVELAKTSAKTKNGDCTTTTANHSQLGLRPDSLESTRAIAHQMMAIDFKHEIEYLSGLIKNSNIPLVFSHNDIHQNNVILLHDSSRSLSDRVVLIDFEYCSYNYLTFDLANHMSEWCFDYIGDDYPNFTFSLERLPSTERQRQMLSHYINSLDRSLRNELFSSSVSNGDLVEMLLAEMPIMLMASNLLWCIWAIRSVLTSKIKFGYWEMAKSKWDVYLACKQKYQDESGALNSAAGEYRAPAIKLQSSRM